VFAKLCLWFDCVFCVLISVCAKQYLWDDLEDSIIDAVLKTETFASNTGINFLYSSLKNSEIFIQYWYMNCQSCPNISEFFELHKYSKFLDYYRLFCL
jgi:hypothetical protein